MKFLKWLAVTVTVISLLTCVTACNQQPADSSTPTTTTTTAPTTTTTTQADNGLVTYTVAVTDEGGNPIAGALIQICADGTCRPTRTDEAGVATWSLEENDYEVYFSNLEASPETPVEGYTYVDDEKKFYFDGETELTIVLKAVA